MAPPAPDRRWPELGRDDEFVAPFVDIDEWRDEPVGHRYVHGGFAGTDLRFSFYFPPVETYGGRFFQPLLHIAGTEHGATSGLFEQSIAFAVTSGAYLVESNMGSTTPFLGPDPTIAYRASAASAQFARVLAAEMFGERAGRRPFGYVYGGSGGAFKTISCIERVNDVWDGAVPFVHGTPVSIPNVFSVQAHAMRLLWSSFPAIVDALDPGGSGDMYAGLDDEQRDALAEVTRMGFPPRVWFDVERINGSYTMLWTVFADMIRAADPEYFTDFWTRPGYLGHDSPESLVRDRVDETVTVVGLVTASESGELGLAAAGTPTGVNAMERATVALRVSGLPAGNLRGATMELLTGAAAGRRVHVTGVVGDIVLTGLNEMGPGALEGIEAGDQVHLTNADYLAFQTFHRHQIPDDVEGWEQFLVDGTARHPQRRKVLGPYFARHASGSIQSGRFDGKMIVVQMLLDEAAHPLQAVWYRRQVANALGDDIDRRYRLWFVDHATHETHEPSPDPDNEELAARLVRTVPYRGVVEQALLDLSAWVEQGIAPAASTDFDVADGQVVVAATASARRGIQPVVDLRVSDGIGADGLERATVSAGDTVTFTAMVEVPPGAGFVTRAEWDFLGTGEFPAVAPDMDGRSATLTITTTTTFDRPGTYFPALRITSHRHGDRNARHGLIQNLGRVRVVVRADA